jgi:selenide,water dikinase
MYRKGESTGSNQANRAMVNKHNLEILTTLDTAEEEMLYDPQTSGGLLLSLPDSEADALLELLHNTGVNEAVKIGEVVDEPAGIVVA